MSFDPRVTQPDEPGDDFQLPNDLAAIGEQLRDDVVFLASRFPANPSAKPSDESVTANLQAGRVGNRHVYRVLGGLAAAAILFLVLLPGALRFWQHEQAPSVDRGEQLALTPEVQKHDRALLAQVKEPAPITSEQPPVVKVELTPVILLNEATGPELEGLLDLLESEALHQPTLSI